MIPCITSEPGQNQDKTKQEQENSSTLIIKQARQKFKTRSKKGPLSNNNLRFPLLSQNSNSQLKRLISIY